MLPEYSILPLIYVIFMHIFVFVFNINGFFGCVVICLIKPMLEAKILICNCGMQRQFLESNLNVCINLYTTSTLVLWMYCDILSIDKSRILLSFLKEVIWLVQHMIMNYNVTIHVLEELDSSWFIQMISNLIMNILFLLVESSRNCNEFSLSCVVW